ncbi:hypothetical protein [Serratia marcescens]|uniref:hypothetical protein n=1 Tax=Serratia marcescens TaxID=615 RepID=UPI0021CC7F7B|nr:hypothetical protein [Serratia marcescens]
MGQQQEGIKRVLTVGEINLARSVFGRSVFYEKVFVHCDSYLPFGLQASRTAMAPNGEVWFRQALYKADFSTAAAGFQHVFIHEMSHVWQHQKGMWVRTRGLLSWLLNTNIDSMVNSCCITTPWNSKLLSSLIIGS